ncbi:ubiquinol-cytochrome C chaperone family protein [Propylenella binzhouense]|uniref:Ubiquinol-cytochrome C chaperone n=1 Tax=Propylenella binzhouense TaxID=2555902 RepID=A0A964T4U3_9HYPH|nr:ubiquinol-cytochrome C chaperone family protein [Propylenella binzhouense]MYZ48478.1 ubiquinol-cytochrome C chaperone [Propylenella binzhouense]
MLRHWRRSREERDSAERLYAAVVDAARRPEFYEGLGVPDTVEGRFELLALHFYPVIHRLMYRPDGDPELARRLSEAFVRDMDAVHREMGIGDISVPKRLKKLYGVFAGRISAYRDGLRQGGEALADVLDRTIFFGRSDRQAAARLAAYLAEAVAGLEDADLAEWRAGAVRYPGPPAEAMEANR